MPHLPGGIEWIVIGLVALLLFGKRLPGVARSLGQTMHEFRSGLAGKREDPEKPQHSKSDGADADTQKPS